MIVQPPKGPFEHRYRQFQRIVSLAIFLQRVNVEQVGNGGGVHGVQLGQRLPTLRHQHRTRACILGITQDFAGNGLALHPVHHQIAAFQTRWIGGPGGTHRGDRYASASSRRQ